MHIKCPACGAVASLEVLLAAEDGASEVVSIAGEMPPELWKLMVPYLALFRPAKTKLSWARTASLLSELHGMVKNAQFERGGRVFCAPLNYWLTGIEQMLAQRDRLTLPLKTHGYLFEVMMSLDAKSLRHADKQPDKKSPEPSLSRSPAPMPAAAQTVVPPLSEAGQKGRADFLNTLKGMTLGRVKPPLNDEAKQQQREHALEALEQHARQQALAKQHALPNPLPEQPEEHHYDH